MPGAINKDGESCSWINLFREVISRKAGQWTLGLIYVVLVASIWIVASYIVQSVVDTGVSPFLITYICNSLFIIYIPIVEIARYFEDKVEVILKHDVNNENRVGDNLQSGDLERVNLLQESDNDGIVAVATVDQVLPSESEAQLSPSADIEDINHGLDSKGRWTRVRMAKVSLLICPFWFLAQLTFNFSLKYTTVASNTILSSMSSLFTFLVALVFLGETFTWIKLISVLLCMAGSIIVSLADSSSSPDEVASNPLLGDILTLLSAGLYAVYITLIRKTLPDEKEGKGKASMAQFLGFLGLFNMLIFLPVVLVLNFANLEPFHMLTWEQVGLIIGKGLLDNVLSDYLWAQAVLLTTTTVATAGLMIQVPIAAVVDALAGQAPHPLDYVGGVAILVGFAGISIPSDVSSKKGYSKQEQEEGRAGTSGAHEVDDAALHDGIALRIDRSAGVLPAPLTDSR